MDHSNKDLLPQIMSKIAFDKQDEFSSEPEEEETDIRPDISAIDQINDQEAEDAELLQMTKEFANFIVPNPIDLDGIMPKHEFENTQDRLFSINNFIYTENPGLESSGEEKDKVPTSPLFRPKVIKKKSKINRRASEALIPQLFRKFDQPKSDIKPTFVRRFHVSKSNQDFNSSNLLEKEELEKLGINVFNDAYDVMESYAEVHYRPKREIQDNLND